MQTFLPVADFADSARLLDSPPPGQAAGGDAADPAGDRTPRLRLGQPPRRPDVRGRTPALVAYGLAMARIWRERGFGDSTEPQIGEFAPQVVGVPQAELPMPGCCRRGWGTRPSTARTGRTSSPGPRLLPAPLRRAVRARTGRPAYVWPEADDVAPAPEPQGVRVWVVRPRAHGGGPAWPRASSAWVSSRGSTPPDLSPAELRALSKELTGRRPAKDLRQLSAFLDEIRVGDRIGLPIEHGAGLLLGEVAGEYRFEAASCCRTAVRPGGTGCAPDGGAPTRDPAGSAGAVPDHARPGRPGIAVTRREGPRSAVAPARGRRASRPRTG